MVSQLKREEPQFYWPHWIRFSNQFAQEFDSSDTSGFYVQLPIGFEGKIECGRIIV